MFSRTLCFVALCGLSGCGEARTALETQENQPSAEEAVPGEMSLAAMRQAANAADVLYADGRYDEALRT